MSTTKLTILLFTTLPVFFFTSWMKILFIYTIKDGKHIPLNETYGLSFRVTGIYLIFCMLLSFGWWVYFIAMLGGLTVLTFFCGRHERKQELLLIFYAYLGASYSLMYAVTLFLTQVFFG